jgi:hypothetical protein
MCWSIGRQAIGRQSRLPKRKCVTPAKRVQPNGPQQYINAPPQ